MYPMITSNQPHKTINSQNRMTLLMWQIIWRLIYRNPIPHSGVFRDQKNHQIPWYRIKSKMTRQAQSQRSRKIDIRWEIVMYMLFIFSFVSVSVNGVVFLIKIWRSIAEIRFHATELQFKMHWTNNLISGFNLEIDHWLCFKVSWHAMICLVLRFKSFSQRSVKNDVGDNFHRIRSLFYRVAFTMFSSSVHFFSSFFFSKIHRCNSLFWLLTSKRNLRWPISRSSHE